jgi:oligopeptide/dipeptide ABC transporter ATP-binding protein
MTLLDVRGFSVELDGGGGDPVALVHELSLTVERGEFLCVVGESGSGKTVAALSFMRLLEYTAPTHLAGEVLLDGDDVVAMTQTQMAGLRGRRMAMIFQEAMEALNPTKLIGAQLIEAAMQHPSTHAEGGRRRELHSAARAKALDLLDQVGITDPAGCLDKYPHQLSGGMQQRVMIAMALMCDPELLIADEPTTALDVTIQAGILNLLVKLQRERDMACILITHDMGVAAAIADFVAVVYAGRLVEIGSLDELLHTPRHPYTRALLDCVPRADPVGVTELATIAGSVPHPGEQLPGCRFAPRCPHASARCTDAEPPLAVAAIDAADGATGDAHVRMVACIHPQTDRVEPHVRPVSITAVDDEKTADPVGPQGDRTFLELNNVSKRYSSSARGESLGGARSSGSVLAVDGASLALYKGEFFGLVGESGSGKSTLGRLISHLEPVTGGTIAIDRKRVDDLRRSRDLNAFRQRVQMIFQDASGSLDPRQTIGRSVAEPLKSLTRLRGAALQDRVRSLIDTVGLPASYIDRRPSELSGGQRQRVAIARAIACDPELIVADEPTSALDVSVQGQIVNVLRRLQRELGLTYLFITHNLSLVLAVADRVGVMYLGALVEIGDAASLATRPAHPYTQLLLTTNPDPTGSRRLQGGEDDADAVGALDIATAVVDRSVGCRFRDRCPKRQSRCDVESPALTEHVPNRLVACHYPNT